MPKQRNSPKIKTSAKGVKYMDVVELNPEDPGKFGLEHRTRKSTRTAKDINKVPHRKDKNAEYTF